MYNYRVYNNLFWIFLIQMKYRLQSMYNHMVGRAVTELYLPTVLYSLVISYTGFNSENEVAENKQKSWTAATGPGAYIGLNPELLPPVQGHI